jgi:hypothetical protein
MKLQEIIVKINESVYFKTKAHSIYTKFLTNYTNDIKWNILKTDDLELNLPCTLSKCILMPSNLFTHEPNWDNIKETLMHEQVHILQRLNQRDFNEFYKDNAIFGKYLVPIAKSKIDYRALNMENIVITNPDEDEYEWIIKDTSGYYIVPYIIPKNSLKSHVSTKVAYQIDLHSLVVTGNKKPVNDLDFSKYITSGLSHGISVNIAHPNETFTDLFLL